MCFMFYIIFNTSGFNSGGKNTCFIQRPKSIENMQFGAVADIYMAKRKMKNVKESWLNVKKQQLECNVSRFG